MELGLQPIWKKFLQPNYLAAFEFKEGFVFARVVRRRLMHYKPYALITPAGVAIDIPPNGATPELRLRDPRNPVNEILYLNAATNAGYGWILHGSIGLKPEWIWMYPRFPEGKDIPGRFPNIDPVRPTQGDATGYVSSVESPYEAPTDFVEYVIPPLQHIGFEFFNKDPDRSHQPVLNVLFALYWFQPLTPERHSGLIRAIAKREVPAAFMTVGFGDTPLELGDRLAEAWGVEPLSLEEAAGR